EKESRHCRHTDRGAQIIWRHRPRTRRVHRYRALRRRLETFRSFTARSKPHHRRSARRALSYERAAISLEESTRERRHERRADRADYPSRFLFWLAHRQFGAANRSARFSRCDAMKGAVLYGPRDVRFEERDAPKIIKPTDAVIRMSATCVCGSDLWPYRGINPIDQPTPMGHEYCGIVEEVGSAVTSIRRGQFVIGSFFASDNTCPICQAGYQSSCLHSQLIAAGGAQAERLRVPLADGTLVATPDIPSDDLIPSLLAASDVLGTGWFGAVAAEVGPGKTVAVVGDGAVGLLAVLAAQQLGAQRIIAMSRHETRQQL